MPHINEDIIRKKLKEIKIKSANSGRGKTDHSVAGMTVPMLADQINDLLDDRPRLLYVAQEYIPGQPLIRGRRYK